MNEYFHKKTILITGAASGIGRRLAVELFAHESSLILWDIESERLRRLHETGFGMSDRVHIYPVDVTDTMTIQTLSQKLIKEGRTPDILFHCAGIIVGKLFADHTPDEIRSSLQINLESMMQITSALLPGMLERGSGHIVNIASASGYIGNPRMSVYTATKWGVIGWSESLYLEMKRHRSGIAVTTVIPGYVDTGMFKGVIPPRLVPLLRTERLVHQILIGTARKKRTITAPFLVRVTPLLRAILPARIFDWLAGKVFKVYQSMDTFEGRTNR